jgi:hypothetical protein
MTVRWANRTHEEVNEPQTEEPESALFCIFSTILEFTDAPPARFERIRYILSNINEEIRFTGRRAHI